MRCVFAILFCLCVMLPISHAQTAGQSTSASEVIFDPVRFDDFGDISFKDDKARLHLLALVIEHLSPDRMIYLYAYAGRRSCAGEAQARALRARNYLVHERGLQEDRIVCKDGGYREERTLEVWVWVRGMKPPSPTPTPGLIPRKRKHC